MLHPVHRIWYLLRSRGEEPNWGKTDYLSHIKLLVGIKVGWGRRWEGGSEWGIHVHPWLIHVNIWQNPGASN